MTKAWRLAYPEKSINKDLSKSVIVKIVLSVKY